MADKLRRHLISRGMRIMLFKFPEFYDTIVIEDSCCIVAYGLLYAPDFIPA